MAQLNIKDFPDDLKAELRIAAAVARVHERVFVINAVSAAIAAAKTTDARRSTPPGKAKT